MAGLVRASTSFSPDQGKYVDARHPATPKASPRLCSVGAPKL